jgi:hypothetical protein
LIETFIFRSFSADVFEGQIITSIATVIGLCLLLLKEYIVMNTPRDAPNVPVEPAVIQPPIEHRARLAARVPPARPSTSTQNDSDDEEVESSSNASSSTSEGDSSDAEEPLLNRQPPVVAEPEPANININVNVAIDNNGIAAEVNAQGDFTALYELFGIQGPIENMIQNVVVFILIVIVAIGFGAWLPYVIGKMFASVTLKFLVPLIRWAGEYLVWMVKKVTDPLIEPLVDIIWSMLKSNPTMRHKLRPKSEESIPSILPDVNLSSGFQIAIYVLLGYSFQLGILLYRLHRSGLLSHPFAVTLKRTLSSVVGNVVKIFKLIFFFTIELGIFPFYCGCLIDFCLSPALGSIVTLEDRLNFYSKFPWTFVFLHWLAGTTFMFQFALYVSVVRQTVRPGVMWFIRDPNDPQFQPMNDIMEKPILTQLRKLAVGTFMYTTIILSGIGGFVLFVWGHQSLWELLTDTTKAGPFVIWPLKWEFR